MFLASFGALAITRCIQLATVLECRKQNDTVCIRLAERRHLILQSKQLPGRSVRRCEGARLWCDSQFSDIAVSFEWARF